MKKGQVLFIIDQVPYKAALETAIANVRSAEAQLATAKLTAQSKETLHCCPEKFYHKVSCTTEPVSGTLTGTVG